MAEARDRALNEIATLKEDLIETLDSFDIIEERKDIMTRALKDLSKVRFIIYLGFTPCIRFVNISLKVRIRFPVVFDTFLRNHLTFALSSRGLESHYIWEIW